MCGQGGLLTSKMRNTCSGQGPPSSLNCPAILVLEFQSTGDDSPIDLCWGAESMVASTFSLKSSLRNITPKKTLLGR